MPISIKRAWLTLFTLSLVTALSIAPTSKGGQNPLEGTPYEETQDMGAATPADATDTNRIDIVFDPEKSRKVTPCEKIVFIQAIQMFVDGNPVDPGDYNGSWEWRDLTVINDLEETEEDEQGTYIDSPAEDEIDPYTNGDGEDRTKGYDFGDFGSSNSECKEATWYDRPTIIDDRFRPGGDDAAAGNDWDASEIRERFETCAFCAEGEDAGKFFECLLWEVKRTQEDMAGGRRGEAKVIGVSEHPSEGFKRALETWVNVKHFNLPKDP